MITSNRKGMYRMRKHGFYVLGGESIMLGYCPRPNLSLYLSPKERNQGDCFYIFGRILAARVARNTAKIYQFPQKQYWLKFAAT